MLYVWTINGPRDNTPDPNGGTVAGGIAVLLGVIVLLAGLLSIGLVGFHLFGLLTRQVDTQLPVPGPVLAVACIVAMVVTAVAFYRAVRHASEQRPLRLLQKAGLILLSILLGYATVAMATYGATVMNAIVAERGSPRLADFLAVTVLLVLAVGIVMSWPGRWRLSIGLVLTVALGGAMAMGLAGTGFNVL